MPRPGPRPYECVRRAWHSDRHQPMRGSLIQEIFRIANQVHSPATRKNKEWQEKLPFVVLKAEEIMYSKANSEAEYMDLKTLWDRANDAIDTIIRKDDTVESGDLLQPCIEAALNLGCIPRRASRSQRHSNPGCYLSSTTKDASSVSPNIPDNHKVLHGSSVGLLRPPSPDPSNLGCSSSWYSALLKPTYANPTISDPSRDGTSVPAETLQNLPGLCRIYPLYYCGNKDNACFQPPSRYPQHQKQQNMATTTMTSFDLSDEKTGTSLEGNVLGCKSTMNSSSNVTNCIEMSAVHTGYDLSLRLGLPSTPWLGADSSWTNEVEDVGSSSSCDDSKSYEPSFLPLEDKCFDFFQVDSMVEPLDSCSSKWSFEAGSNLLCGGL
ncbi:uncharacterized protein [Typha latifolia]|uniref:uncharacterized protein isoform X1 n=1 Tax=Typha latifolia TaxID=4733 RepID=UPI003C3035C1